MSERRDIVRQNVSTTRTITERNNRQYAAALLELLRGNISIRQFDLCVDQLCSCKIELLRDEMWGLTGGIVDHKLTGRFRLSCTENKALLRCILFLIDENTTTSDVSYEAIHCDQPFFPFQSREAYRLVLLSSAFHTFAKLVNCESVHAPKPPFLWRELSCLGKRKRRTRK
jgi:hypothetical protein